VVDGTVILDNDSVQMIAIDELVLSFNLKSLVREKDVELNEAWIKGAQINLRNAGSMGLNIDEWVYNLNQINSSRSPTEGDPGFFGIDKITLLDSKFSLSDDSRDSIKLGFDFNHFRLQDVNAEVSNLKVFKDTFQIDVNYLSLVDQKTNLKIDELKTFFSFSRKGMAFYDLDLHMGKTHIKDSVVFRYEKTGHMAYFIDSVDVSANFNETVLHSDEISLFAPELSGLNEHIELSGYFKGRVKAFYSENFVLNYGVDTKLHGSLEIEGLPDINESLILIGLDNSTIKATDFEKYLAKNSFKIINKLGLINLEGRFEGFFKDFVTDGHFKTEIGNIDTDTKVEIRDNGIPTYNGNLSLDNFDIGHFIEDSLYQKINLKGSIQGSGFTLEQADFFLDAKISSIGINGYDYKNIETNGRLAKSFFSGKLNVDDNNFILKADGSVDLRNRSSILDIEGTILRANLDELNIASQDMMIASDFKLDFVGIKLDSINGAIALRNSYVKYRSQDLKMDSLFFNANRQNGQRTVNLVSDFFDIDLLGDFEFSSLLSELESLNEQYKLIFSSKQDEVKAFLENRNVPDPFDLRFTAKLPDISPLVHLFDTAIQVAPNATLSGNFTNNTKQSFSINVKTDTLKYANILFINNELDINANDMRDSIKVLTLGYLYSEKQIYANTSETQALRVEAVWDGKHIGIVQDIIQESSGNYAEIGADIDFFDDRTELTFDESILFALNKTWHINEDNVIVFGEKKIDIMNLKIYNENQSIDFSGEISVLNDSSKTLQVIFQDVQVENINTITNKDYSGIISGNIKAQNLYYNPLIFGNLDINELKVNDVLVGNVDGSLLWNDSNELFDLTFEVNRNGKKIIDLSGDFYPSYKKDQLDLMLQLKQTSLDIVEPFIEDFFSDVKGTINGDISIKGNLNAPVFKGTGTISGGALKVDYLNTNYSFDGELEFGKDIIAFNNFNLKDVNQSQMTLSGDIRHDAFKKVTFDLKGDLENFNVLNTTAEAGDIYYGKAFASGTLDFKGETSNLNISANVITQPNTKLYIPITESSGLEEVDFIKFIKRGDTTAVEEKEQVEKVSKVKVEGLNLDLDIGITPDAYTEIIIDAKTGDIIRGRGNGQLRLQVDSEGNFNMTGGLEITEGAYNFSFYNIIVKEFNIEQASKITWYGDPFAGIMQINASYSQNTSLTPLLNEVGFGASENGGSSAGRRFPTKVLLNLYGELLSPEIKFDIDLSGVNTQDFQFQTAIDAFKNKIASDEQELNRQVLSLILLNRFSEQGNLNIGGQTASQNVSQLLSSQLSQFITQLDENLEIDLDLADLSEEAFENFQVRLAYTFLNGRLRISREGGLTNLVDINSLAGDWTAEYLLTQDGKYKVKVYSRTNYDLATAAITANATSNTTGASITQTTSFNTVSEFFHAIGENRKEKRKKRREAKAKNTSGKTGIN